MTAPDPSDGIETAPPPAVSSLRSRFEKLAADSSPASSSSLKPPPAGNTHLAVPPSPRLRTAHERESSDSSIHSLHSASSSSDLKATAKRPPPPPPVRPSSRAPSPANPRGSPLLRPVADASPSLVDHDISAEPTSPALKPSLLARRPPPPPPPHDHPAQRPPGVSSLIKQFG
ncbi:hypothetical protein K466DRAFT_368117 [Polyporus arcularius HHB13444]|uniref:Uncharacterized protein n=1 Tax=Polyporus arcularius HHB13444 TaxID=1314778 RepID=A0A5C3NU14_9APHY|nr:hypothetical protein K466DRAFT_368117 [Polyporus arcularius HHB13444]